MNAGADGIRVRVNNTDRITMQRWSRIDRGLYAHASGRRVRRIEPGRWEVVEGPQDGSQWQSMHWAMYQAAKDVTS
jgi:hypothetical protein